MAQGWALKQKEHVSRHHDPQTRMCTARLHDMKRATLATAQGHYVYAELSLPSPLLLQVPHLQSVWWVVVHHEAVAAWNVFTCSSGARAHLIVAHALVSHSLHHHTALPSTPTQVLHALCIILSCHPLGCKCGNMAMTLPLPKCTIATPPSSLIMVVGLVESTEPDVTLASRQCPACPCSHSDATTLLPSSLWGPSWRSTCMASSSHKQGRQW